MFQKSTVAAQLHFFGALLAIVGIFFLLPLAAESPGFHFTACLIFGVTGVLVFAASAALHFATDGYRVSREVELRMEGIDQVFIFLFIAGSYTPVLLNLVSEPWALILLSLVWIVCLAGIGYTLFRTKLPIWAQHRYLITGIFVSTGWILLIRLGEVLSNASTTSIALLLAGAMSYTLGAGVYALKRPNPWRGVFGYHEIWHLMVIFGFTFHYFMIYGFYA